MTDEVPKGSELLQSMGRAEAAARARLMQWLDDRGIRIYSTRDIDMMARGVVAYMAIEELDARRARGEL